MNYGYGNNDMKRNEVPVSTLKNLITVMSCAAIIVSTIYFAHVVDLFINSMSFLMSNMLLFYATEKMYKKYNYSSILIKVYTGVFILLLVFALLTTKTPAIDNDLVLMPLKLVLIVASVFAPIFSFKEDADFDSNTEKSAIMNVRTKIADEKKGKIYSNRDKNAKLNKQTKLYLKRKKPNINQRKD